MRKFALLSAFAALLPFPVSADNDERVGTSAPLGGARHILDTGEVVDTYGSVACVTDQQRIDLYRTFLAFGGSYILGECKLEHNIDISCNEVWAGTTVFRNVTYCFAADVWRPSE